MTKAFTEDPEAGVGVSRRAVVAGLFALPALDAAQAAIDPHERVRRDADALAASMRALHGRECRVCVDHQARMVVVIASS